MIESVEQVPAGSVLIDLGGSEIFHFSICGISSVYVKGGVEFNCHGWFAVPNIQELHNHIADVVLQKETLGSLEFRFLRKEIGLTINEAGILFDVGADKIAKWEDGEGFAPAGIDGLIRSAYNGFRRTGYIHNLKALRSLLKERMKAA